MSADERGPDRQAAGGEDHHAGQEDQGEGGEGETEETGTTEIERSERGSGGRLLRD
jgi:hypothetical protein